MTPTEAKRHIANHNAAHQKKEPFAVYITQALGLAVEALDRLTPEKPVEEADEFGDRPLCCPHCLGPVTNYWAPGTKPKHCQFCGQALDWGEEAKG